MALTRVQAVANQVALSNTLTLTFAAPPTVGNAVIVPLTITVGVTPLPGQVTDNRGNTYELVIAQTQSGTRHVAIYACLALTATGTPFTITAAILTGATGVTGSAIEIAGATGGGLEIDAIVGNGGASATTTPTTGTTPALRNTGPDAVVVAAVFSAAAQASITVGVVSPSWTQEYEQLGGSNNAIGEGDSRIIASPLGTTQTAAWTFGTSTNPWVAALAVFGSADTVPPPTVRVTQDAIEILSLPTPALRVTQSVIEILSVAPTLTGDPRVTQLVAETITHPTPDARVGQLVVEVLTGAAVLPDARVTQLAIELATKQAPEPFIAIGSVTQLVVETATPTPHPPLNVSQSPVELLEQFDPPAVAARLSQLPVENLQQFAAAFVQARLSQAPLETVQQFVATLVAARVSQAALEIIYPFGCYVPQPPPCTQGEFPIDSDDFIASPPTVWRAVRSPRDVPTNTTPATALDLGSLPVDLTQDVSSLPAPLYTVWYRYTAVPGDYVIGVWAETPDDSNYYTLTRVYTNLGVDLYLNLSAYRVPLQLPVTPGETYYFEVKNDYGPDDALNAPLHLTILAAPNLPTPIGAIAVPDDTSPFPLAVLSGVDGTAQQFRPGFPAGEAAAVLPNLRSLWDDSYADVDGRGFQLLDETLTVIASPVWVASVGGGFPIISARGGRFYVGEPGRGAFPVSFPAQVTTISDAGVFGPVTWILPEPGLRSLGVSPDETILYHTGQSSALGQVLRWDLINHVALTPLAAGVTGYSTSQHDVIRVLADGTILVGYFRSGASRDSFIRRYTPDGTILHTYPLGNDKMNKLALGLDDPLTFWIWSFPLNWVSRFQQLRVSDGVVLTTFDATQYEEGVYQGPDEAPTARFGHSFSCPFVVLPYALAALPGPTPPEPPPRVGCSVSVSWGLDDSYVPPPIEPPTPLCPLPVGTIMVGGYGDSGTCVYLSPNGATSYPQPPSAPVPGTGVSAFARTADGHVAVIGGNAPNFPATGAGLFKNCELTVLSQYTGSRSNGFCVAADALGSWYVMDNGSVTPLFRITRLNAAAAEVATWDIPMLAGYGNNPALLALAVSGDGQTAFAWIKKDIIPPAVDDSNTYLHKFDLSGAGTWAGQLTPDYNWFSPGYGSLLVVPGTTDLIVAFDDLNGVTGASGPGALRRYTASGVLVWSAGTPAGASAGDLSWEGVALGLPGDTHFLAWAYDDAVGTSSGARYCWFAYATGAPDNTRNFTPAAGGFQFDSQVVVLSN